MRDASRERESENADRQMLFALEGPAQRRLLDEDVLFEDLPIGRIDPRTDEARRERECRREPHGERRASARSAQNDGGMEERGDGEPPKVAVNALQNAQSERAHGKKIP